MRLQPGRFCVLFVVAVVVLNLWRAVGGCAWLLHPFRGGAEWFQALAVAAVVVLNLGRAVGRGCITKEYKRQTKGKLEGRAEQLRTKDGS